MTSPAQFFLMPVKQADGTFAKNPDGTLKRVQSSVQMDASGNPVAVATAEQFADWDKIQAARPLTMTEHETKLNAAAARPVTPATAEPDAATVGGKRLNDDRAKASLLAGTFTDLDLAPPPVGPAEYEQRANAAAQLAASLGLSLVMVPAANGALAHLELRQSGNPYAAGDLVTLERQLSVLARERAENDRQIQLWRAHREQLAAEQAERIANLPENRLARLEAALAAQGITVDA